LRFFRPGTAVAFGGAAALGKLMGFDAERQRHAFSIVYGQLGGTMQAHTEGSLLLALQMGFAARNATFACDLAAAGIEGPENILEGPFGYFRLIEGSGEPAKVAADLGRSWRITEVAHKPFPSGRATHGIVDACLALRERHGLTPEAIESVVAYVPPLVAHLVGRPPKESMAINYARLCARYVGARALIAGTVRIEDFTDEAYRDAVSQSLAARTSIEVRDRGDPNALTPIEVEVRTSDGRRHTATVEHVYGSPQRPMTRDAHLAKLRRNASLASPAIPAAKVDRLIALVDRLEAMPDVARLVDEVVAG
jgi:2-methylcitrate dehydratase PrpD